MLRAVQPPKRRELAALVWVRAAKNKCPFAWAVYARNRAARVLGTAYTKRVQVALWDLENPVLPKQQAIIKEKVL